MTFIGIGQNDYGTPVSMHICDTCGEPFTNCPVPSDPRSPLYAGCTATTCGSYVEAWDIDKVWDAVQGIVQREEVTE